MPAPPSTDAAPESREIAERLAAAVERSPADETSIAWLASLDGRHPESSDDGAAPRRRQVVEVRVRERERVGFHRCGSAEAGALDAALRQALAQARLQPPSPPLPLPGPASERGGESEESRHDPRVAALDAATAGDLLASGRRDGERWRLDWHELRLAVANSRGLERAAAATSLTLTACHGDGPGAGWAAGSARRLDDLPAPAIVERARSRAADGGAAASENAPDAGAAAEAAAGHPLLLAPEAVVVLLRLLAATAFSSRAVLDGVSFLAGRFGQALFAPALSLVDDGTDAAGLPFPCDADGWPKRPVPLIEGGTVVGPAVDPELGRALGATPTPHAVAADESRPGHLLLAAGEADAAALLAAAEGGLAVCRLENASCDPSGRHLRALARGVRRVAGGALDAAAADFVWEADLERLLAAVAAVGGERLALAADGAWGGTVAPALVLGGR